MLRSVIILGVLAGAGWSAYRKLMGSRTGPVTADGPRGTEGQPDAAGGLTERVTQTVSHAATAARQAATTAVSKARAAAPIGGGAAAEQAPPETGAVPPEARAAAMAAMPAVQPPATIPER